MLRRLVAVVGALLVAVAGCDAGPDVDVVVVGVGSSDEQRVLAALSMEALTRAGVEVEAVADGGDTVALREAALDGEVDLYWDYTGAAWVLGLEQSFPQVDPVTSYEVVSEADAELGLIWLAPSQADATLSLFVRAGELPEPPNGTLTWLAGQLSAGGRPLCADPDFLADPAGYATLAAAYSIQTDRVEVVQAAEDEAVALTADGTCFAGLASATSGAAVRAGLAPVEDDQRLFPAFIAAPVVRQATLDRVPTIAPTLQRVAEDLTTARLAELTARVLDGDDPADVAVEALGTT